ncbi:MAG: carbohydrate ABC transporter permease [Chloroflexi bacterium]|nr:carbohydrate ABC transporter permease [Anaerolineaceae bacterium]NMB90324.1 carbohydrate ABC transporter permease [Chloroflexota bacterium]
MTSTDAHWKRVIQKYTPRAFQYVILTLIAILVTTPVIMIIFGGLKTRGEFMTRPYTIPNPPHWDNYINILSMSSFWQMLLNSLIVMIGATTGVVLLCSLAAFVFARMNFRLKGLVFNLFTLGLMFPINIAILPVYLVLRQTSLTNTLIGVILVQVAFQLSTNIFILRGFFMAIPNELQDAAYLDGCSAFDFYWRIMLPLARPSLASVAALTMIISWNDLLVPLVALDKDTLWTLPLGTMQFQGQYGQDLALVAAFVTLSALPTLVFYLLAERHIVAGLTAGALKG